MWNLRNRECAALLRTGPCTEGRMALERTLVQVWDSATAD